VQKFFFQLAIMMFFVIVAMPAIAVYANDISVTIDGRRVVFEDQGPVVVDGRTLVPIRGVFETIGFRVYWREDTQQISLDMGVDVGVSLQIGRDDLVLRGEGRYSLDVPPQIIGDRAMLPLRAILEVLGYRVTWNEGTQTVVVTSARAAVGENVPIGNIAIAGIPVSRFYGLTSDGVTDIFGPPEFGNFLRYTYNFPDGHVAFSFNIDGLLTRIEAQASALSANGISLNRNRAELMSMFGRGTIQTTDSNRAGSTYRMMYAVGDYMIEFWLDNRHGTDATTIEVIMEAYVPNPLG